MSSRETKESQSSYTRKKEEEESKRAKDRAEREAVLHEFTKYFEEDDDAEEASRTGDKRHRAPGAMLNSGPGSLDNDLGFRPPPKKARTGDTLIRQSSDGMRSGRTASILALDDEDESETHSKNANRSAKQAASKPTLQLQDLPLDVSEAKVKGLLPESLNVLSVRIIPPPKTNQATGDRRSNTAIATIHADTSGRDMDDAIRLLDNKYVGYGHHLKISRGLSSTAMESRLTNPSSLHSALVSKPFGARAVTRDAQTHSLSRAPPPSEYSARIAPPQSYAPSRMDPREKHITTEINIVPPPSLHELKAIHRTIEGVLSMGPRFEALLMSRPEVQNDEKWAWIWDARSQGGVYYRWRLWTIVTGAEQEGKRQAVEQPIFENNLDWTSAGKDLPFEFIEQVGDIALDSEYDSDAEEESDDEGFVRNKRFDRGGIKTGPGAEEDVNVGTYLDPMQKAKLLHLLARLPTTIGKLTRGDVARVMAFAIGHANVGVAEIVDLLVVNVLRPFCTNRSPSSSDAEPDEGTEKPATGLGGAAETNTQMNGEKSDQAKADDSSARLVSLYLISDIMSASTSCNVRSAWRYRSLFEAALRKHNAFGKLGRLDRDLKMGRMTAEKFKRSVHTLLGMWQEWSTFSAQAHEDFAKAFDNPPLTDEEKQIEERKAEEKRAADKAKARSDGVKAVGSKPKTMSTKDEKRRDDDLDRRKLADADMRDTQRQSEPQKAPSPSSASNLLKSRDSTSTDSAQHPRKFELSSSKPHPSKVSDQPQGRTSQRGTETARAQPSKTQPSSRGRARAEDMFGDSD